DTPRSPPVSGSAPGRSQNPDPPDPPEKAPPASPPTASSAHLLQALSLVSSFRRICGPVPLMRMGQNVWVFAQQELLIAHRVYVVNTDGLRFPIQEPGQLVNRKFL